MSLLTEKQIQRNQVVRQKRMTDTCTVQRILGSATDGYGQPVKDYSVFRPDQVCFFEPIVQKRGGEQLTQDREFTEELYKLEMPVNTNILETDRITDILDETGFYKLSDNPVFEVKKVVPFLTYSEISLQLIS